jgi:pimeloyl-ACP methyl ester carboxylesterase
MAEAIPIILLPGMAAGERLFESQVAAFPTMLVQKWIDPLPRESLRGYAARLARVVDPGRPCIVGGASFGGIVALEMAHHLPATACILIGSIRSTVSFSWKWRLLRPLALLGPERIAVLTRILARSGHHFFNRSTLRKLQRLAHPEAAFVRWATCAVLQWQPSPMVKGLKVFHIHGSADHILPASLVCPDVLVPGGSHALSLFNPWVVNGFIAGVLEKVSSG